MAQTLQSKVGHHYIHCQISRKPVIFAAVGNFTELFLITVGDLNYHIIFWVGRYL